jgi:nucleoside 2-deoxyribosyltransferase
LKHSDATVATYKRRQMKCLKQVSETLVKTSEKIFENHCKHIQHSDEILANVHIKHLET